MGSATRRRLDLRELHGYVGGVPVRRCRGDGGSRRACGGAVAMTSGDGAVMKARGGAGSIWTVDEQNNIVAKIYHESVNVREYEPKIEAMIASRPTSLNKNNIDALFPPYTWP